MTQIVHCHSLLPPSVLLSLPHWLSIHSYRCSSHYASDFCCWTCCFPHAPKSQRGDSCRYPHTPPWGEWLPVFCRWRRGLKPFFRGPSAGYLLAPSIFAFVTSTLAHAKTPIWKDLLSFLFLGECTCLCVSGIPLSLHFLGRMGMVYSVAVGLATLYHPGFFLKGLIVTLVTKPVLSS